MTAVTTLGSIGGWRPCEIILPAAPAPLCRAPLFKLKSGRIDGRAFHSYAKERVIYFFLSVATHFWLDDMYLKNPIPLPVNSNPFFLLPKQTFHSSNDQLR
ncbi:hypothetical protein CDAR_436331 [Caerostris darwini]|uniref:Choline/carnitine acyltransferase domain-containing protein n=1 Tax=Caerostris darwini TaxID=1538125 RepID=A0AAV4R701_9ARAC|nr:hypothetical protein CDAR_436331 [Caerostris darwini]